MVIVIWVKCIFVIFIVVLENEFMKCELKFMILKSIYYRIYVCVCILYLFDLLYCFYYSGFVFFCVVFNDKVGYEEWFLVEDECINYD